MARLRPAVEAGPVAEPMPAHLRWGRPANDLRWQRTDDPREQRRMLAHRRHGEARQEYLAGQMVQPIDAHGWEYFTAHGLVWASDAHTRAAAHLTYRPDPAVWSKDRSGNLARDAAGKLVHGSPAVLGGGRT
jgi:hypothetical protein